MYTVDELRAIIKEELDKKEYIQEPYSLFEPILYILEDGGKRLRPLLTLMAYNLYREDIERVLKSAIGIEIFHNYTLLHDDVMDDAELRRGRQTVHKKWNSNVAILSGDAAAITAYQCIEHCEDKYLRRAIDFFNQSGKIYRCHRTEYFQKFIWCRHGYCSPYGNGNFVRTSNSSSFVFAQKYFVQGITTTGLK